jgi:hypothetical protein
MELFLRSDSAVSWMIGEYHFDSEQGYGVLSYHAGDQIKKTEMGGACSMYGRE